MKSKRKYWLGDTYKTPDLPDDDKAVRAFAYSLEQALTTDAEHLESMADRLIPFYNQLPAREREIVDYVMTTICGWTCQSIMEGL
jgi:hypothetical protein